MKPLRFSDLKKLALSPAHFKANLDHPFEQTRSMRIGTVAHHCLLGPSGQHPLVVYGGKERKGNSWLDFAAANNGATIVTMPEWAEGEAIAFAAKKNPIVEERLVGARCEVPLRWEESGFACETGGVDLIGNGWIDDYKTSQSAEPARFMKLAMNLYYPQQLAWYEGACRANGIDTSKGCFIIASETVFPYVSSVFKLTDALLEHGRRTLALWLEKYRACVENDFWPGYSQSIVEFDVPVWMNRDDVDEDEGEVLDGTA